MINCNPNIHCILSHHINRSHANIFCYNHGKYLKATHILQFAPHHFSLSCLLHFGFFLSCVNQFACCFFMRTCVSNLQITDILPSEYPQFNHFYKVIFSIVLVNFPSLEQNILQSRIKGREIYLEHSAAG